MTARSAAVRTRATASRRSGRTAGSARREPVPGDDLQRYLGVTPSLARTGAGRLLRPARRHRRLGGREPSCDLPRRGAGERRRRVRALIQDVVGLAAPELADEVRQGCSSFTEAVHKEDSNEVRRPADRRAAGVRGRRAVPVVPSSAGVPRQPGGDGAPEDVPAVFDGVRREARRLHPLRSCRHDRRRRALVGRAAASRPADGVGRERDDRRLPADDATHAVFTADPGVEAASRRRSPAQATPQPAATNPCT